MSSPCQTHSVPNVSLLKPFSTRIAVLLPVNVSRRPTRCPPVPVLLPVNVSRRPTHCPTVLVRSSVPPSVQPSGAGHSCPRPDCTRVPVSPCSVTLPIVPPVPVLLPVNVSRRPTHRPPVPVLSSVPRSVQPSGASRSCSRPDCPRVARAPPCPRVQ